MRPSDLSAATWRKSSHSNQDGGECVEMSYDFVSASWRKSSYSNSDGGECIEVSDDFTSATWRKSSHSNSDGGACVEVSDDYTGIVPVRDSKTPSGPVLVFPEGGWSSFVTAVKSGRLTA